MTDDGGIPPMRPVSADDVRERPGRSNRQQAVSAALYAVTMIGTTFLLTVFHIPAIVFYVVAAVAVVVSVAIALVRRSRRRRTTP